MLVRICKNLYLADWDGAKQAGSEFTKVDVTLELPASLADFKFPLRDDYC